MLDRLERADRPAELVPGAGVLGGGPSTSRPRRRLPPRTASRPGRGPGPWTPRAGLAGGDDRAGEPDGGQRPGEVDRGPLGHRDARMGGRDRRTTPRPSPVAARRRAAGGAGAARSSTGPISPVTRSGPSSCQAPVSEPGSRRDGGRLARPRPGRQQGRHRGPARVRRQHQAGQQGRQHRARDQRRVSCSSAAARSATVPPSPPAAAGSAMREHAQAGQVAPAPLAAPGRLPAGYRAAPCAGCPSARRLQPADAPPAAGPLRPVPDRRLQGQLLLGGSDRHRHLPSQRPRS